MDKLTVYFVIMVIYTKGIWCKSLNYTSLEVFGDDDRIVGGMDTTIEHYPYQAFLLLYDGRGYFGCGGSIISRYYIVSAAHCLPRIQTIYARIGSTYRYSGGTEYATNTFMGHPRYDSRTSDYDVAIITITQGMNLDGYSARAISLANTGNDPQEGVNMIITGWGDTVENGTGSDILQVAQVPVVSRANCNEQLGNIITSRMFCAGYAEGGVDTCQGDSGGPAVSSRTSRLSGITSFGFGCARPDSPGVYTRIGNFEIRNFIRGMTGV